MSVDYHTWRKTATLEFFEDGGVVHFPNINVFVKAIRGDPYVSFGLGVYWVSMQHELCAEKFVASNDRFYVSITPSPRFGTFIIDVVEKCSVTPRTKTLLLI